MEKKSEKKVKWALDKNMWQPQSQTNLRQYACTSSSAFNHPRCCWVSSTLSYHQTMLCHYVTDQRPMLLLPDRANQWQWSEIAAFKQIEQDVTGTEPQTQSHRHRWTQTWIMYGDCKSWDRLYLSRSILENHTVLYPHIQCVTRTTQNSILH